MMKSKIFGYILLALFSMNMVSAVFVDSVNAPKFFPGDDKIIQIQIENVFEDDVKDLSFRLDFSNLPFTPVGSAEDSVDELDEGDEENFAFRMKAANDIAPGDYKIPYTLAFERNDVEKTRSGTLGVSVGAETEISFSVDSENNVVGEMGEITLKIVNSGFGDIRFVNVRIIPEGFTLLSTDEIYVGTVDSDDFETSTFDVIYDKEDARLVAIVEYRDFDNVKVVENINAPLNIYSREEGLKLGIIKKSNAPVILGFVVLFVLAWILYRMLKKRRRIRKSARR